MRRIMERKNWLGYVAALGLFVAFPTSLQAQGGTGGQAEDAQIIDTKATSGTINLLFDTMTDPDGIRIYYPPRKTQGSKLIYEWHGGTALLNNTPSPWGNFGVKTVNADYGKPPKSPVNKGTKIEIVVNEGSKASPGTWWAYTGTISPTGKPKIKINRGAPLPIGPPPKVTTTGTIFRPGGGSGNRSTAGVPKNRRASRGGNKPNKRRGTITRIVGPTTSVKLPAAIAPGGGGGSKPNPTGQWPKVLFSGKGSITTHIRKLPTRSVRRIALRGGRP